jgi:hypothetical protein
VAQNQEASSKGQKWQKRVVSKQCALEAGRCLCEFAQRLLATSVTALVAFCIAGPVLKVVGPDKRHGENESPEMTERAARTTT